MTGEVTSIPLKTPVLLMIFRRPETTRKVLDAIRSVRPRVLCVAADGPRADRPEEAERCEETRDVIRRGVDWDCDLRTHFRVDNLGLRRAVVGALDWFFENTEEGIVLEDDCVADPSFFGFCEWMLEHHRDNPFVMHICGDNYQDGQVRGDGAYFYSKHAHVWGWAGWRRAWRHYDVDMKELDRVLGSERWLQVHPREEDRRYWESMLRATADGRINSWDYQLALSMWRVGGVAVNPNVNLVSNIGFTEEGTFNTEPSRHASLPVGRWTERRHPTLVGLDADADRYTMEHVFGVPLKPVPAPKNSDAEWSGKIARLRGRLDRTKGELNTMRASLAWRCAKWIHRLEQRWRSKGGSGSA